jgi:hypothetical protein
MKISINNLRKIIRETIEEIATPGDYRYGNARGGVQSGGMSGGEPQFMQPGIDSSNMAPQGVGGAGKQYIQQGTGGAGKQYAAGQGSQSSVASDDPGYSDSLDSSSKFLLTIESNVLKGKNGQVSYFNGNVYSVDSSSDKSSQDFANLFHTWDKKSSSDLASSVIKILMQHDFIEESPVPVELLDEIGVRTTSGNVMEIVEYFSEYNNGYIARNETRQRRGRRL